MIPCRPVRSSMARRDTGTSLPVAPASGLRCWEDRRGDLHLASRADGGRKLLQAIDRLIASSKPTSLLLALDDPAFDKWRNPVRSMGVKTTFRKLRIERVDDPAELVRLQAGRLDSETAQIRVARPFLTEFLALCQDMASGKSDFSVGGRQRDTSRREWRNLTTREKESACLWFWGDAAPRR